MRSEKNLWNKSREWFAGHALWEMVKYLVGPLVGAAIGSVAWARLTHATVETTANIFLLVLGILVVAWGIGLLPIKKEPKHRNVEYSIAEMRRKISVFLVGSGPQLYVTPEKGHLTIETIQLIVVNTMPFPVDLENMQVDMLLDGTNLASKDANIPRRILGSSIEGISLRHELTDNQAKVAREYRDKCSCCPLFKIGGMVNFRTSQGLLPIRVETDTRCIIHKDS